MTQNLGKENAWQSDVCWGLRGNVCLGLYSVVGYCPKMGEYLSKVGSNKPRRPSSLCLPHMTAAIVGAPVQHSVV